MRHGLEEDDMAFLATCSTASAGGRDADRNNCSVTVGRDRQSPRRRSASTLAPGLQHHGAGEPGNADEALSTRRFSPHSAPHAGSTAGGDQDHRDIVLLERSRSRAASDNRPDYLRSAAWPNVLALEMDDGIHHHRNGPSPTPRHLESLYPEPNLFGLTPGRRRRSRRGIAGARETMMAIANHAGRAMTRIRRRRRWRPRIRTSPSGTRPPASNAPEGR